MILLRPAVLGRLGGVRAQLVVAALLGSLLLGGMVIAGSGAMFISSHDLSILLTMVLFAALLAVGFSLRAGTLSPPSRGLASRAMESLCRTLLAIGEINCGSPAAAVAAARHALRIGRETDNDWAQANAMVLLGYGLWETGEYAAALRLARSGLRVSREVQHPGAILMLAVLDSALRTTLGLEDSDPSLLEVLAATGTKLPPVWRTTALSKLSADRAKAGDQEAALRYALEASEIRAAAPARLIFFDFERCHETEVMLRGGGTLG